VLYVEISRYDALRWFPQGGIFGEVGVFKGDFSHKIIEFIAPKKLHLIDVWKWTYYDWDKPPVSELKNIADFKVWAKSLDPEYDGGHPDRMLERFYQDLTRLAKTERRSSVQLHRGQSSDIGRQFPDRYFDVIYIDADHHYDAVLADLFAYAPKLKRGGILWGDDFLEDLSRTDGLYGTIDAVNTFVKRTDFKCLAILGCSEAQYVLYREMSGYVDQFLARMLGEKRDIVEISDTMLSRFAQRTIKTSSKSGYQSRRVPSFV
jgi:hypothetical protein